MTAGELVLDSVWLTHGFPDLLDGAVRRHEIFAELDSELLMSVLPTGPVDQGGPPLPARADGLTCCAEMAEFGKQIRDRHLRRERDSMKAAPELGSGRRNWGAARLAVFRRATAIQFATGRMPQV
jgi:hypothetical protein